MSSSRPTRRPRLRLVLVALGALASLGALVVTRPPLTDSAWSRGDDLALAVAWLVAVAASAWLFVATGVSVIALVLTRPVLARRWARTLPFGVRRLVEIAIVTSCVALPALPAQAAGPPPVAPVVVHDQPIVRAPEPPAPVTPAPARPLPVPRTVPPPAASAPAPTPAPRHVVVRAGDNLWLIARASLERASGHGPGVAEVARYWREVMDANRSTLRSGNPSLIFPGEIVALPPPPTVS